MYILTHATTPPPAPTPPHGSLGLWPRTIPRVLAPDKDGTLGRFPRHRSKPLSRTRPQARAPRLRVGDGCQTGAAPTATHSTRDSARLSDHSLSEAASRKRSARAVLRVEAAGPRVVRLRADPPCPAVALGPSCPRLLLLGHRSAVLVRQRPR